MGKKSDIELFGRKTFFISPEKDSVPEEFLEEFMASGLETYIVNDDASCPMAAKVEEIMKMFPESILIFNIDSKIAGMDWESFLKTVNKRQGTMVGIMYGRGRSGAGDEEAKSQLERMGKLSAGAIPLGADKEENKRLIKETLLKIGARGRRNLVRAACKSGSSVKFSHGGKDFSARLMDINVTHFLCDIGPTSEKFDIFEKIRDAEMKFDGFSIKSDAVLIMKRKSNEENLFIFMFIKPDGTPDLEKDKENLLNKEIYSLVMKKNMTALKAAFAARKN
jgi:hypothetical protein